MKEKTKDVYLGDERYQIGRMTPWVGSWMVAQIITKMLPMGIDNALALELKIPINLPLSRSDMTEEQFHNMQKHCLDVVKFYEASGPAVPIVLPDGRFVKDISTPDVIALTVHALLFNVSDFFVEGAAERIAKSFGLEEAPSNRFAVVGK